MVTQRSINILMKEKEEYVSPCLTVVLFSEKDVISTSNGFDGEVDDEW